MSDPTSPPLPPVAVAGPTRRSGIGRRDLLAATVSTLFAAGAPALAVAQEAEPPLDPRLSADTVTFQVRRGIFKGLLVRPRVAAKRPGVLLIPDQRGPSPYWRSLARRYALEGFTVLLPDLLAPFNQPEGSDEAINLMARIIPAEHQLALDAAADLLAKHPECNGSIAVVGFVWGGPYAMQFAITGSRVKAVVIHYATLPTPDKAAAAKVPVQFHWVENDPRTTPQVEPLERKMIGAGRVFESWVYPGVAAGFASDAAARVYNKEAADRAFDRAVFFLRRYLGGG